MKKYVNRAFRIFRKKDSNLPACSNRPSDKSCKEVGNNDKTQNKIDRPKSSKPASSKDEQWVLLTKKRALIFYRVIVNRMMSPFIELLVPIIKVTNLNDFRTHNEVTLSFRDVDILKEELCLKCNENPAAFNFTKKSLEIEECIIKSPFDIVKCHSKRKYCKKSYNTKRHLQPFNISKNKIQKSSFLNNMLIKKIIDYNMESMMPNMNTGKLSNICDFRINDDNEQSYLSDSNPVKLTENVMYSKKDITYSNDMNAEDIGQSDPAPIIMAIPLNTLLDIDNGSIFERKPKSSNTSYKQINNEDTTSPNFKSHVKVIPPSQNVTKSVNLKNDVVQTLKRINSNSSESSSKISKANVSVVENPTPRLVNNKLHAKSKPTTTTRMNSLDEKKTSTGEFILNNTQEAKNNQHSIMRHTNETLTQIDKEIKLDSEAKVKNKFENNTKSETNDLIGLLKSEECTIKDVDDHTKTSIIPHKLNEIPSKINNLEDSKDLNVNEIRIKNETNSDNKLVNVEKQPIIESYKYSNNAIQRKTRQIVNDNSDKIVTESISKENKPSIVNEINIKNEGNNENTLASAENIPIIESYKYSNNAIQSKTRQILNDDSDKIVKESINKKNNTCFVDKIKTTKLAMTNKLTDQRFKTDNKSYLVSFKTKNEESYLLKREQHNGKDNKGDLIDINTVMEKENQKPSNPIKEVMNGRQKNTVHQTVSGVMNMKTNNLENKTVDSNALLIFDKTTPNNRINSWKKTKTDKNSLIYSFNPKLKRNENNMPHVPNTQIEESIITNNNNLQKSLKMKHNDLSASSLPDYKNANNPGPDGLMNQVSCNDNIKSGSASDFTNPISNNLSPEVVIAADDKTNFVIKDINTKPLSSYNTQIVIKDTISIHDTPKKDKNSTFKANSIDKDNNIGKESISNSIAFKGKIINQTQKIKTLNSGGTVKNNISNQDECEKDIYKELSTDQNTNIGKKCVVGKKSDVNIVVNTNKIISTKLPSNEGINSTKAVVSSPTEKPIKQKSSENKIEKTLLMKADRSPVESVLTKNKSIKVDGLQGSSVESIVTKNKPIKADKPDEQHISNTKETISVDKKNVKLKNSTLEEDIGNNKVNFNSRHTSYKNTSMNKHKQLSSTSNLSITGKSSNNLTMKEEHKVKLNTAEFKIKMNELLNQIPDTVQPLKSQLHNEYLKSCKPDNNHKIENKKEIDSQKRVVSTLTKAEIIPNKTYNKIIKTGMSSNKVKPKDILKNIQSKMLTSRLEKKVILDDLKTLEKILNMKSLKKQKLQTNQLESKIAKQSIQDIKLASHETGARLRKVAKIVPHIKLETPKDNTLVKENVEKAPIINNEKDKNNVIGKSNLKSFMRNRKKEQ